MAFNTTNTRQRPSRTYYRRKMCKFCADKTLVIDYKEVKTLKYFTTERGKIMPSRISGFVPNIKEPWLLQLKGQDTLPYYRTRHLLYNLYKEAKTMCLSDSIF